MAHKPENGKVVEMLEFRSDAELEIGHVVCICRTDGGKADEDGGHGSFAADDTTPCVHGDYHLVP